MGTQVYTLSYITVAGGLLTQAASIDVKRSSNSQAVLTLALGYAGESPGAAMVEIQVVNAVPADDFEFNADAYIEALQAVEAGVSIANRALVVKGFIIEDSWKQSVNAEGQYDFRMRAGFARFQ